MVLQSLTNITTGRHADRLGLQHTNISPDAFANLINTTEHPFLRLALAGVLILAMGDKETLLAVKIARAAFTVSCLLRELTDKSGIADCHLADARRLPIEDDSIEGVITSPPYINVFNYHQNYRRAVELLGWKPLEASRSEIGANRKHRANRFFTVVQ